MNTRRLLFLVTVLAAIAAFEPAAAQAPGAAKVPAELRQQAIERGNTRVIVELRAGFRAEGRMTRAAAARQRGFIRNVQNRMMSRMSARNLRLVRRLDSVPFVAFEADAAALDALAADPDVVRVVEDRLLAPDLAESINVIEADTVHQLGLNGQGGTVAILDTGVDGNHPFLAGRVVEEACYATGEFNDPGDCPNGAATQTGPGAAEPCAFAPTTCAHGTHVAGIAAGAGSSSTGVSPAASIIAVQVFHSSQFCGWWEELPCARAFASDIAAGLERVYELRDQYPLAAVNMSLGGSAYSSACDNEDPGMTAVIDNLQSAGIATVIASGNAAQTNAISFPSCISSAISVGATDDVDDVASFSNASPLLDLFAPGVDIESSVPGGDFAVFSGTSMAAPHVAGAFAVARQANPGATVQETLTLLIETGRPVADERGAATLVKPRLRMTGVAGISSPAPALSAVAPNVLDAWTPATNVTITGSGFVRSSYALVNGSSRPTSYVSDTSLIATLLESDLATTATSLSVAVATPPLGGGTSVSTTVTLLPPVFSFSSIAAAPGEVVTVSWSNGPTAQGAWVSLGPAGGSDFTYGAWSYIDQLATPTSWDVTMPSTLGDYEVRLYSDGGYNRVAAGGPISVSDTPSEPGAAALAVSATEATPGETVTVQLSDGSGDAGDWLALAAVGAADSSYFAWTYVGAGNTSFSWSIAMPGSAGDYEFRLFDSANTRLATSAAVTVSAGPAELALTVSATEVEVGQPVTVSLAGGPGGSTDWLALAPAGAADTTYLQWTYVSGNTSFDWTVNMPSTPGNYEFRFYANGNYTVLARSPLVSVGDGTPDPSDIELTVGGGPFAPGDDITLTLAGGYGGATDWLAFAATGSPATSYLSYTYVGNGVTARSWTVTAPSTAGDYEFRYLPDGGYVIAASSASVTVEIAAPPPPLLEVDTTTAAPGGSVTMTLSNGFGGSYDWLSLARVGAAEASYLQWTYVGAGVTSRSWTVSMPSTAGDYEFRLYRNNSYTREATSPSVSVQ